MSVVVVVAVAVDLCARPRELDALVPFGAQKIDEEVGRGQRGQQEVEPIQMPSVQVPRDPAGHVVPRGELHHHRHQQAAHVVPKRDRRHAQRAPKALEPVGGLRVEELELPHVHEDLGRPDQHVLRDLPEDAERAGALAARAALVRVLEPEVLDGASRNHGEDRDDEADPHALQLGEAVGFGADPGDDGVKDAAVNEDEGSNAEDVEARHARGGDVEAPEGGPHAGALLDEEGCHLSEDDGVEDGAEPDGEEPQNALDLFDLGDCAETPWIILGRLEPAAAAVAVLNEVSWRDDRCFVQELESCGVENPPLAASSAISGVHFEQNFLRRLRLDPPLPRRRDQDLAKPG